MKAGSAAWRRALIATGRVRTDDECRRYSELVGAVKGTEGRACFQALLDSIRVRHDHGLYEGTWNALWRFPKADAGRWFAEALLAFQRRMGRTGQVERFALPAAGRGATRTAFVRAVAAMPAAERTRVIALLRRWRIENDGWEPVLAALGAPVAPPPAAGGVPADWPPKWKKFLAEVERGKKDLGDVWGYNGSPKAIPQVVALLTVEPGPRWRELDALTNPVFVSFCITSYPQFVAEVRALPADARARALKHLGRAAPWKRKKLAADLRR